MKKVMIIGPALKMGGIERATVNLANLLDDLSVEVCYVALFKLEHFFQLNSGIVFYEPKDFNDKKLSLVKTLFWIRTKVKSLQPDVIVVYSIFYAALTQLALLGTGKKVIISERSSPLYRWPFKIRLFSRIAFSLKPPAGIIAQTNTAATYQRVYYGADIPVRVIPNALKAIQLYPKLERENTILAVGRFNDHLKGFDRLIEAFALLQPLDWTLVFAGGDENGQYLKDIAHKLGVLDKIKFLGAIKDLDHIYAVSGLFVIPSRSEGFPNALCEAMAAGMACISFNFTAGPSDLIEDNINGLLVDNGNIELLAEKIQYLINHPVERLRLGNNALKIKDRLSQENIGKSYYEFIMQIANS